MMWEGVRRLGSYIPAPEEPLNVNRCSNSRKIGGWGRKDTVISK